MLDSSLTQLLNALVRLIGDEVGYPFSSRGVSNPTPPRMLEFENSCSYFLPGYYPRSLLCVHKFLTTSFRINTHRACRINLRLTHLYYSCSRLQHKLTYSRRSESTRSVSLIFSWNVFRNVSLQAGQILMVDTAAVFWRVTLGF